MGRWLSDPALWQQQYHRAYDSLGWVEHRGFGKTTRSILAAGLTVVNFIIDVVVIVIGFGLFASDWFVRYWLIHLRWYGQWVKRSFHVHAARYRNLSNPSKWRL